MSTVSTSAVLDRADLQLAAEACRFVGLDVTAAQLRTSSEPFGALPTDAQYRVIRQHLNASKAQASMRAERVTDPMERHNLGLLITALDGALVISLDAESDARAAAGES